MLTYNHDVKALVEDNYHIHKEAHHAALLTTGNGYFGIRGSFEEFGVLNVQGTYIRGLIGEVIEIPSIYVDNIYMRKYYINELEAKQFEYQDASVNIADFLYIRFKVGNTYFYPWEGKIISWLRYIDTNDGSLKREVVWDDGFGNQSKLTFKRYASFANNHAYFLSAELEKLNHDLPCTVESGIDTWIKTNGQKISKLESVHEKDAYTQYLFNTGDKYQFDACIAISNTYQGVDLSLKEKVFANGTYYESLPSTSKKIKVQKTIYANATVDYTEGSDILKINSVETEKILNNSFDGNYKKHLEAYQASFSDIDIKLSDDKDDALLKYANYQTLISVDRFDQVHSVTAKNLTGEKYNQFIWWDAEIYQFPIYLMINPEAAKNLLMYRYNRLEQSRQNAKDINLKGVKFAFCSSVLGDEKVWAYARHPFMQIHINSDIAYAIMNYYKTTKDFEFMRLYGIEMMYEIALYFASRVEYNKETKEYELNQVTGTDEHHPYVDNNSYTNYMVSYFLEELLVVLKANKEIATKLGFTKEEETLFKAIKDNIKRSVTKDGYIPQFDDYFNLRETLEITGNGAAKGFQMKESGLYHESQIIKQPDVMMLFTYINLPNLKASYERNWKYYERMCESSSSLTYPAHAIASIDNKEYDKFYDYWYKSCALDIIDHHKEAHLGLHAACMAGGWYSIYRGLFGFKAELDYLEVNPTPFYKWQTVEITFYYQGIKVQAQLKDNILSITSDKPFNLKVKDGIIKHAKKTQLTL